MSYTLDLTYYLDQLFFFDKIVKGLDHVVVASSRIRIHDLNYIKEERIPFLIKELSISDLCAPKVYKLFQLERLIKTHLKNVFDEDKNKEGLSKTLLLKMLKIEDSFVEKNFKDNFNELKIIYYPILYLLLAVFDFKQFSYLERIFLSEFYEKNGLYFMKCIHDYKQEYLISQVDDNYLEKLKLLTTENYESFFFK